MNTVLHRTILAGVTCLAVLATGVGARAQRDGKNPKDENPRPKFSLKAQPNVGIAPARVVLTAELSGGANDFQEYYCPTVLWDGPTVQNQNRRSTASRTRPARAKSSGGTPSSTSSKPARTKCGYG